MAVQESTQQAPPLVDESEIGPVGLSVCVPPEITVDQLIEWVNDEFSRPGVTWMLSTGVHFTGLHPVPCRCEYNDRRIHYLFHARAT